MASIGVRFTFREAVSSVQGMVQDLGGRLRSENVNGRRTALKPSCCCLKTIVLKSATCTSTSLLPVTLVAQLFGGKMVLPHAVCDSCCNVSECFTILLCNSSPSMLQAPQTATLNIHGQVIKSGPPDRCCQRTAHPPWSAHC